MHFFAPNIFVLMSLIGIDAILKNINIGNIAKYSRMFTLCLNFQEIYPPQEKSTINIFSVPRKNSQRYYID